MLSVLIRPEIQEKISIGLLLLNAEEVYFNYSLKKLKVSKWLLSAASFKTLKELLKNLEHKMEPVEIQAFDGAEVEIFKNSVKNRFSDFTPSYVSYLNRYSNNLIGFSEPKDIYIDLSCQ